MTAPSNCNGLSNGGFQSDLEKTSSDICENKTTEQSRLHISTNKLTNGDVCDKQFDASLSELFGKLNIDVQSKYEFTLLDIYKFSVKFYKEKAGKAIQLSYKDNCHLAALNQQIIHGPFNPATCQTLGVLDVVGRDRRLAWQSLGEMTKDESMKNFVEHLNNLTPIFKPYIEAVIADCMEKQKQKEEEEERKKEELEEMEMRNEQLQKEEEEKKNQELTKRQIQEALNRQTFSQFKSYAEEQFPSNPEQQAVLIKTLQEQHFQQYMQQVYQQQLLMQQTPADSFQLEQPNDSQAQNSSTVLLGKHTGDENHLLHTQDDAGQVLKASPASMWTRRDIKEFKSSIKSEGGDSIIKIGHGETVTVRVPTHPDGTCLFWEFATDSYDLGFGVFFEWRDDSGGYSGVTVHVSESGSEEESEDEDEDEDDLDRANEDDLQRPTDDVEKVAGTSSSALKAAKNKDSGSKPPQTVIIPVYRRDCHEEVYAGSHSYPGNGVYLLKFDNSYSLWRSKMLYYRVYYTQR